MLDLDAVSEFSLIAQKAGVMGKGSSLTATPYPGAQARAVASIGESIAAAEARLKTVEK